MPAYKKVLKYRQCCSMETITYPFSWICDRCINTVHYKISYHCRIYHIYVKTVGCLHVTGAQPILKYKIVVVQLMRAIDI